MERQKALNGCDEVVFLNQRGELTEGTRTTLFLEQDGRLFTPALACGLLPGTLREELLDLPRAAASEAVLTPADLARADRIYLGNSVRGLIRADLMQRPMPRHARTCTRANRQRNARAFRPGRVLRCALFKLVIQILSSACDLLRSSSCLVSEFGGGLAERGGKLGPSPDEALADLLRALAQRLGTLPRLAGRFLAGLGQRALGLRGLLHRGPADVFELRLRGERKPSACSAHPGSAPPMGHQGIASAAVWSRRLPSCSPNVSRSRCRSAHSLWA